MEPLSGYLLGETDEPLECAGAEEHRQAAVALIEQSERYLDIFSAELEPAVYDNDACYQAMLDFVLRNPRHSRIRLLIRDPVKVARRGHRLLELGMRLSSHVQMRKPSTDDADIETSFLLADRIGLLYRESPASVRAILNFCDIAWANQLAGQFDRMWENAELDPNLRRLML